MNCIHCHQDVPLPCETAAAVAICHRPMALIPEGAKGVHVPYFAEGTPAMIELEAMVDKAGIRNVLYALSHIANAKACHVAEAWQDTARARVWDAWATKVERAAGSNLADPLAP